MLALTWRLGRGWARLWPLVGVLAAGLFLVHFRVFLFYLPLAALVGAIEVAKLARPRSRAASAVVPLLLAGALALLLVMPRVAGLLADTDPLATIEMCIRDRRGRIRLFARRLGAGSADRPYVCNESGLDVSGRTPPAALRLTSGHSPSP